MALRRQVADASAYGGGFAGAQGHAQLRSSAQPGTGPVARVTGKRLQALENAQQAPRAEAVASFQRAVGIAEAEVHRLVDILDAGNALLGDVAGEVDDHRQYPLDDEAGTVAQHRDPDAVASQ